MLKTIINALTPYNDGYNNIKIQMGYLGRVLKIRNCATRKDFLHERYNTDKTTTLKQTKIDNFLAVQEGGYNLLKYSAKLSVCGK